MFWLSPFKHFSVRRPRSSAVDCDLSRFLVWRGSYTFRRLTTTHSLKRGRTDNPQSPTRRVGFFAQLLLAFLLVALLPLTLFWQFERFRNIQDGERDAQVRLQLFSDRVIQQVNGWTRQNASALRIAASLPETISMDQHAHQKVVASVARQLPWAYLIHTTDLAGMDVARSDLEPPASYRTRTYYAEILRGAAYSAEVRLGLTSHRPALMMAVPIADEAGHLHGLLIEASALDAVSKATSATLGRTGFAFLMTPDGHLIAGAREPDDQNLKDYSAHPAFAAAEHGNEGIQHYVVDGIERIASVRRTDLGWIVVAQQDAQESLAAVHEATRSAVVALGITAALVTLLSFVVARGFAKPIERVTEVANQISQGNLDLTISTRRHDQIGDLVRAMQGVRQTLQRFLEAERQIATAAGRGDFSQRGDEASFQNVFRHMVRHLNRLMETADDGLGEVATVLAAVTRGDLTARMKGTYEGTFANLQRDINTTVHSLATLIQQIEFNRGLLRATLEHLPQGVSVVDSDLRLVAWNRRYVEIFGFPEELVQVGRPIEALIRYNAERGLFGSGDQEAYVQKRLQHLRTGLPHALEREFPGNLVLEIRGNPVPGVGYATSYTDVSAYKHVEGELRALAETLERRVSDRTQELQRATAEADRANRLKSKFLAAAVHDLSQPINAAHLYIAAIKEGDRSQPVEDLAEHADRALASVDDLLSSLMDISRLESGKLKLKLEDVRLEPLLESVCREFSMLAGSRGLRLGHKSTRVVIRTDVALLRRVLRNFVSNAIRYTSTGGVLVGVRYSRTACRIGVWDTGCGIPADKTEEIFEEFRRLELHQSSVDRGAGLGLSIVRTISKLLNYEVSVRSCPGRGSVFSVDVPRGDLARVHEMNEPVRDARGELKGRRVWCIDDDREVRDATRTLLERWGCQVTICGSGAECLRTARNAAAPDLLILDYRLRDCVGPDLLPELESIWSRVTPVVFVSGEQSALLEHGLRNAPWPRLAKPIRPAELRAEMLTLLPPETVRS